MLSYENGKRKIQAITVRFGMPRLSLISVAAAFFVIGSASLLISKAATSFVSTEAEVGTMTGAVAKVSDASASGGEAVRFGAATACTLYPVDTVAFPADAGIVNVKSAYGAKGDGVTDDTAALRRALQDNSFLETRANNPHIDRPAPITVFLPAGTYLVSDSLIAPGSSLRITGAGTNKTIIKLKNNSAGFTAGSMKYVLKTGNALASDLANSGFTNYVQNLTVDVGSGNPGAVGVRFDVANSGAMQHVLIRSSDPAKLGARGLTFETVPGPALVQDVTIDGFDTGIYFDRGMVNNIVLSDMRLMNQRVQGVLNDSKNAVFENLSTTNVPTAIRTQSQEGTIILVGGKLSGRGGGTAIQMAAGGFMHARDVSATGFNNIISTGSTARFVGKTSFKEWSTHNYRRGNSSVAWTETSDYASLNLPIKKAPFYENTNLADWANVRSFGATNNNDGDDDGPAIQRAIDSGKSVVYFPYGRYSIKSNVIIRGNVKKLDFFFSMVSRGASAAFTVGDVTGGTVVLENADMPGSVFVQNGPDTMVVRNMRATATTFVSTGPNASGDIFLENAGAHATMNINRPVKVWARQTNRENKATNISGGATVWVLGDNIEINSSKAYDAEYDVSGGSKLELLGGAFDVLGISNAYPTTGPAVWRANNSAMSVVMGMDLRGSGFGHWLQDVNNGSTVGNMTINEGIRFPVRNSDQRVAWPLYVSPHYQRPAAPTGC